MADQTKKSLTEQEVHSLMDEHLSKVSVDIAQLVRGNIVNGTVVKKRSNELLVSVGNKMEGVVGGAELKSDGIDVDALKPGDSVMVYVLNPSDEKGQLILSIKRTGTARKWVSLKEAKESNAIIEVTVIEANNGGVIVDTGGLRGFIPTSQLDSSRIFKAGEYTRKEDVMRTIQSKLTSLINEKIKVRIIEIDREKNRVILSEKLVTQEDDIAKRTETLRKVKVGSVLKGNVTSITPFGLFVNAEGLEGLVHISEISWDKVSSPADFYGVGDEVSVQIIGLEDDGKRVAYSIKRLQKDPWSDVISQYSVGQIIKGTVQKIVDYGAFVRIREGLNGLIHISEISDDLVLNPREVLKEGQELDLQILSISPTERHLGLSLKRVKSGKEETVEKAPKAEKKVKEEKKEASEKEEAEEK